MTEQISLCSISASLPTVNHRHNGIFVDRRLRALSKSANIRALIPVPWFPPLRPFDQPVKDCSYDCQTVRVPYIPALFKHLDRSWFRRALFPVVREMHRQKAFSAIDSHFGYPTGAAAGDIGEELGIPNFVTLRGVEETQLGCKSISPHLLECLRHATGIITVSHSLKDAVLRNNLPPEKVRVIPNAVNSKMFYPCAKETARDQLEFHRDGPLIVSAGYLIPRKGYHDLIQAFAEVRQKYHSAMLVIVGGKAGYQHSYASKLRKQISDLDLGSSVLFAGTQSAENVAKWLQAADLFSLATYREGCCNVVLEAIASGTPVVATNAGDNEVYVKDGENGFIVNIGDTYELAERMIESLAMQWDSEQIADRVRQYSWDDAAEQVLNFIKSRV